MGALMPTCEWHRISKSTCHNPAYANITISGDEGSIDVAVCERHLQQLAHSTPTLESSEAREQRERGEA